MGVSDGSDKLGVVPQSPETSGGHALRIPLPAVLMGLGLLAGGAAAPVHAGPAKNDFYRTPINTTLTASVVENDNPTNAYTTALLSGPGSGTASLTSTGVLTYAPNPDFAGRDALTYKLEEAGNAYSTARVDLIVPSLAVNDAFTTPANTTLSGVSVTANDTLANGATTVIFAGPASGTAVLDPAGLLSYTPNPGFSGTDVLQYRVADSISNAVAEVTITVLAPQAVTAVPTLAPLALGALVALAGAGANRRRRKKN